MAYGRFCSSWETLVHALIDTYMRSDYYYTLDAQIRERRQRDNDSILQFVSELELMYRKLDRPVSEVEKMLNLRQNLSPAYHKYLLNSRCRTMSELVEACLTIEQELEQNRIDRIPLDYGCDDVNGRYENIEFPEDELRDSAQCPR